MTCFDPLMIDIACVASLARVVFDMSVVRQNSSKLVLGVAGASKLPFPFPTSDSIFDGVLILCTGFYQL